VFTPRCGTSGAKELETYILNSGTHPHSSREGKGGRIGERGRERHNHASVHRPPVIVRASYQEVRNSNLDPEAGYPGCFYYPEALYARISLPLERVPRMRREVWNITSINVTSEDITAL
jgi:hypothetical protein